MKPDGEPSALELGRISGDALPGPGLAPGQTTELF